MQQKLTAPSPGALKRLPDWEQRLTAFFSSVIGLPFVEGSTSCALLAARALDAMTNSDLHSQYAPLDGDDETEAAVCVTRFVRAELIALGLEPVPRNFEQPGDIIVGWVDPFERCAVVAGSSRCITSSREHGVHIASTRAFIRLANAEVFRCQV